MTLRRALSVTTTVAAPVPIDPPRAILPGSFPTGEAFSPLGSGHTQAEVSSVTFPTPLPIRRSTLRRLLSAAKFRVGSGVTY